jgi:hypothetical protein
MNTISLINKNDTSSSGINRGDRYDYVIVGAFVDGCYWHDGKIVGDYFQIVWSAEKAREAELRRQIREMM